jgi:transcriptional regulator with XRE-family HTH domain
MDLLDPYARTASSPISSPERPAAETPCTLLKTARWHAGLTQAEVAQRAQTSQQAVARYEKGATVPSIELLRRLLAACGMRLSLSVSPEPGLVDAPTLELLAREPLSRLPEEFVQLLSELVPVLQGIGLPVLLAGRAAARLRGAVIQVSDLEFWVDQSDVDAVALERDFAAAGVDLWQVMLLPVFAPAVRPRFVLLEGGLHRREVRVRGVRQFGGLLSRADALGAPFGQILVASPADTVFSWSPRDRDRLALQRADTLRRESAGPRPL